MKKPELLSPAGNKESLIAAINAGCDAIYLGGHLFGARNYAGNFSNEEIIEAISYAHIYGVKVYVTVNTVIYEEETEKFINYVDFLHKNNVDAVIIQDLGMMDYLRKVYPNLEIHASTQMNIHNVEGAQLLEELGIKRVVLARETDINLIKEIKEKTNIEIEIFIEGALCLSYSGQCLMSSLIGGRSGNRGTCAQCCRMEYDLISNGNKINKEKYLLSTKDLNTLKYIEKLIEIGVDSFKIEGRMKRPEYVYLMTRIYKEAMNRNLDNMDNNLYEMKKIFNRGFTKGFLFNESNSDFINPKRPNHMGIEIGKVISYQNGIVKIKLIEEVNQEDGIRILNKQEDIGCTLNKIYSNKKIVKEAKKDDVIEIKLKGKIAKDDIVVKTTDKKQIENLNTLFHQNKKIKINMKVIIKQNQPILLTVQDEKNKITIKSDYLVEKPIQNIVTKDRIVEQLQKLGNTPFTLNQLKLEYEEGFIPISKLNELRRKAIEKLINSRNYKIPYQKNPYQIDVKNYPKTRNYSVLIHSKEDYEKIKNKTLEHIYTKENIDDSRKVIRIPRINFQLKEQKDKVLISDLGALKKYKKVITDFPFNVTNSYTVAFLHSMNVEKITLSYELKESQIKKIIENYEKRYQKHPNLEVIISSYPEAMISKFNLLNYYHIKNNNNYLKDKFNNHFRIKVEDDIMTIYHYKKINYNSEIYFNIGINSVRIHIEDQNDRIKIPK